MGTILRRVIALVALAIGIGVAAGTAPAVAATTHPVHSTTLNASTSTHQTVGAHHGVQALDWWF